MARTRTPGVTVDSNGSRTINKEHRKFRMFVRLGSVSQEEAEARLSDEIQRVNIKLERLSRAKPLFSDCRNAQLG